MKVTWPFLCGRIRTVLQVRDAFSSLNGRMKGNETIAHLYGNPLFALHETIQLGTGLNLPFRRRNVLFVRNSVFQSMFLLGVFDSFVALQDSGQNHPCQQMGFTAQSTGVKKSLAWERLGIWAGLWVKGNPYLSQIATFGFPNSWNVARDLGCQIAGKEPKNLTCFFSLPFCLSLSLPYYSLGGCLVGFPTPYSEYSSRKKKAIRTSEISGLC